MSGWSTTVNKFLQLLPASSHANELVVRLGTGKRVFRCAMYLVQAHSGGKQYHVKRFLDTAVEYGTLHKPCWQRIATKSSGEVSHTLPTDHATLGSGVGDGDEAQGQGLGEEGDAHGQT